MQEDPHPGERSLPITVVNKYSYTGNNPLNFTDPSGKFIFAAAFAFISVFSTQLMAASAITWATAGAAALSAATAVGATALGSAVVAGVMSAAGMGSFEENFNNVFGFAATILGAQAWAGHFFGGGIKGAGANGWTQGYVQSNSQFKIGNWSFTGGNAMGGSSGAYYGAGPGSISAHGAVPLVQHEFGHFLQYTVTNAAFGFGTGTGVYLGLGALGHGTNYGGWWETGANVLGDIFF